MKRKKEEEETVTPSEVKPRQIVLYVTPSNESVTVPPLRPPLCRRRHGEAGRGGGGDGEAGGRWEGLESGGGGGGGDAGVDRR